MSTRRVGIEEEYFFSSLDGRFPCYLSETLVGTGGTKLELFAFQLEYASAAGLVVDEVIEDLVHVRRQMWEAARAHGAVTFGCGFHPTARPGHDQNLVERGAHFANAVEIFGSALTSHFAAGTHVHVELVDDDDAIQALAFTRSWLPLLLALSANSPFQHGKPTDFRSWRHQSYLRLPTYGPPLNDVAEVKRAHESLKKRGLNNESSQLYWMVRLSTKFPTLEFRLFDSGTTLAEVQLYALLCKAIVELSTRQSLRVVGGLELSLSLHEAARLGVSAVIEDPVFGDLTPVIDIAAALPTLFADVLTNSEINRLETLLSRRLAQGEDVGTAEEYVLECAERFCDTGGLG